jgi:hypothetical protein
MKTLVTKIATAASSVASLWPSDQRRMHLVAVGQRSVARSNQPVTRPMVLVVPVTVTGRPGLPCADRRVVPDRRQHRVEREADEHRDQHRRHDGDAELVEELADDAAHEADGQEHRDDGEGGGQHRQADLLRAVQRGLVGPLPICTWRTMFSRTTMASSISRPTHSDSAISVTMLIVKPNRRT